jgi:signal transduction histidine kinase
MLLALHQLLSTLRQLASTKGVDAEVAARLLDRSFGVFFAACALLLIVGTPFFFVNKTGSAAAILFLLAITASCWRINRSGNPVRAARLFGMLAWTLATAMLFLGLPASIALFVFAVALMLAVVLGMRAGALFAAGYLAAWLLYIALDARGMAPPKLFPGPPLTAWMLSLIALLLILLPVPELIGRLRKAQIAAESASKTKLQALALMSRHIHGPMNGILGTAQLLEMGELDTEQRELVVGLRSSAEGLQALLDRLLDYSRIEGGEAQLRREPFAWEDLLERLRTRYATDAAAHAQKLLLTLDPAMPATTDGDAARVLQLLDELLTNALRGAKAGAITLTVRPVAGGTELEVADDGPGIAAERLPTLFEPFADASRGEGHGLGLPLAGALVRTMGGRIDADSRPGDTRFRVWLPDSR